MSNISNEFPQNTIVIGGKEESAAEIIKKLISKHPDKFPKLVEVSKELNGNRIALNSQRTACQELDRQIIQANEIFKVMQKDVDELIRKQVDTLMNELKILNENDNGNGTE